MSWFIRSLWLLTASCTGLPLTNAVMSLATDGKPPLLD
jgi:hypothetical protein